MKKCAFICALSLIFIGIAAHANPDMLPPEDGKQLVFQNRILAKVNNKTISVMDVVKKMDLFINTNYPQYANSAVAKYQYFSAQWKDTLLQMVDHELILADAEKLELKTTDSEVRESLHDRFGPNLMSSLDKLGLTYEEAKDMVYSDLVVQKMTWFKIHSKALNAVNSQDIKSAYTSYCKKNPPKETWEYQVLSVRSKNEEMASQIAKKAFDLCKLPSSNMNSVSDEVQFALGENSSSEPLTVTVSEDFKLDTPNISNSHKEVLLKLSENSFSPPVKQFSRADKSTVFRIFHLKNHTKTVLPTLRSMYEKLQNQLIQEAANVESNVYLSKLRKRYGFDAQSLEETIPAGFQPFSLQ